MRKYVLLSFIILISCQKQEMNLTPGTNYLLTVQSNLKASDGTSLLDRLDMGRSLRSRLKDRFFVRIPFKGESVASHFALLETTASGKIVKGRLIEVENRSVKHFDLQGKTLDDPKSLWRESEQELEEVVIICTYPPEGSISWSSWYNFLAMLGEYQNDSSGWYLESSGAYNQGGDYGSNESAVVIDTEQPENKAAEDPLKFVTCFDAIPSSGASFVITIAADIPLDSDPMKFFDWSSASPGHTYIELYKLGANGGSITQCLGFYPNSAWKVISGGDIASKVANDGGHEYNARFSVSVSADQFQKAVEALKVSSSKNYNINSFNCVDWALSVFNAAGAGFTIPKYQTPNSNGQYINTPQGVYQKISELSLAGNGSASINGKAYSTLSKGPCN